MPSPAAVTFQPPKRQPLGLAVADTLRDAIYSGRFGPGDRIAQAIVAQEFGVSQTTIRDALATLEREGLVERTANQGAIVSKLSRADIEEIITLRTTLEVMAVRLVIEQTTDEQVEALAENIRAMQQGGSVVQVVDLDLGFHELLVQFANHKRLLACWRTLKTQIKLLMVGHQLRDPRTPRNTVKNHQALLRWLKARNVKRAVAHVQSHSDVYRLEVLDE